MADDPSSLRDRLQAARIAADSLSFMNASTLWAECLNGELPADEADLVGLREQLDTSLGRIVDQRDFLMRMIRGLGESKLEMGILRDDVLRRFSDEEIARIRAFLTRDGTILTTLENITESLPVTLDELRGQLRDQYSSFSAGDAAAPSAIDNKSHCFTAGVHMMMGMWLPAVGVLGAYEAILVC